MQFRAVTGAVLAGAVASGAYYAYRGGGQSSATDQHRSASTDAAEPTRRALVVDQLGSLYTGTISGSAPVSKETDDLGRKVLEMLTPEQTTAKLRNNEEGR